jgi:cytoskeletal protein CcmA (bactofilin family)
MPNLTTQQTIRVTVNQQDGSLTPLNKVPVVLKNTVQETVGVGGLGNVNEGTPTSGGTLVYNANTDQYDVRALTIRDLGVTGTPSNGDVIIFNGATNTFYYGVKTTTLAALDDVDTTGRANGDVLVYISDTDTYDHRAIIAAGSAGNLSSLTINNTATIISISDFANTTQLGTISTGASNELVSARAIKDYVDNVVGASGGASNLNGLLDVYLDNGGLVNHQVLMYDGIRNEWMNHFLLGSANNIHLGTGANNDLVISLANNVTIVDTLTAPIANVGRLMVTNTATLANNVTVGGTLGVGQQLTVARAATFANSISVGGNASVNGHLSVTGNSTFTSTLTIQSNAVVSQQLSANNIEVSGTLTTTGPVVFGNTSANVQFDAKLGSDLVPSGNGIYSLGSPGNRFKDLYLSSGTLYVGNVVVSDANGTFTVSTPALFEGEAEYTSNVSIDGVLSVSQTAALNGNVALGSNTQDVVSFLGTVNTDIIPTSNVEYDLGSSVKRFNYVYANTVDATTGSFSGDVIVSGNLVVQGDVTRMDVATLQVEDPLIQLSSNNASDLVDMGFFGTYNDGTINRYTGLFRDASDAGKFVLFANLHSTATPTTVVNRSSPSFRLSTLVAYIESGGFVSTPTQVSLTANSTLSIGISANTLSLTTPLGAASGGVGRSTLTQNAVLVGNGTSAVKQIGGSQEQQVLSIVGGVPTFVSSLDAGEY